MSNVKHSDEMDMELQQLEHDLAKILSEITAYLERVAEIKRLALTIA